MQLRGKRGLGSVICQASRVAYYLTRDRRENRNPHEEVEHDEENQAQNEEGDSLSRQVVVVGLDAFLELIGQVAEQVPDVGVLQFLSN